jgi:hypothetical protein
MTFRITGLSPEPFRHLYGRSDQDLMQQGARRYIADESPGYPDRIELREAKIGEALLLVNFEHLSVDTPYRSRHAIFVLEGAELTYDRVGEIPEVLARRLISVRGFNTEGMLLRGEVLEGRTLAEMIVDIFKAPDIAYIHAHNAKQGCYAARIDRA